MKNSQSAPNSWIPVQSLDHPNPQLAPPPVAFTPEQQRALAALQWRSGKQLEVRGHPEKKTIRYLQGLSLEPAATIADSGKSMAETTAANFLSQNRELLLLNEPGTELVRTAEQHDSLGFTQVHYEQTYQGLPVWPASLTVQLNPAGNASLLTGAYVPTPDDLNLEPGVPPQEALRVAQEFLKLDSGAAAERQDLIIYAPTEGETRLAHRLEMHTSPFENWLLVVDAHTGQILTSYNQACSSAVTGSGTDLGGQTRSLNLWFENNQYYMVDTSQPMFNGNSDPPSINSTVGGILIFNANNVDNNSPQYAPSQIVSASSSSGFPAAGVSAAYNLARVYNYFRVRHQRNSINNQGGSVIGVVNTPINNAFWNGGIITLGSADNWAHTLDFVAHEMAHGVTENSANLVYRDQSGAMNEAFSDIFGESTEAWHTGSTDWLLGSQLSQPLRDMQEPSTIEIALGRKYPSKMSEFIPPNDPFLDNFTGRDNGGVHFNSSIINHAYYLLVEGLPGAIGIPDGERIFYRALTTKLQKQSQFIDCRLACVQSAVELFGAGSPQALRTAEAFTAVEIFDQAAPPPPTPVPTVSGPDSLLFTYVYPGDGFTYLARREAAFSDPTAGYGISAVPIAPQRRPAVFGNGSLAMFVTANNDIGLINTQTGAAQTMGFPGLVWSLGVSSDGQFAAFVLRDQFGQPENQINVVNLTTSNVETYNLLAPALDGGATATVLFADSLDFTLDGSQLYYDALNRISFAGGTFIDSWSIYMIDRPSGNEFQVVPPFAGFNIGNPSVGQIHNHRIVFEAQNLASAVSTVYGMNLHSGQFGALFNINSSLGVAYPSLGGDDTVAYISDYAFNQFGFFQFSAIAALPLTANGLAPAGNATLYLQGNAAGPTIGSIYRRGTFTGLPTLTVTATDATATEGGADNAEFTVQRQGSTAGALAFSYVLTGTAGNGSDYQTIPLTASIPSGQSNLKITVTPIDDALDEPNETVVLTLASASHYSLGTQNSANASIVDNDVATGFQAWAAGHGVVGELGNEDLDPYVNVIEYALGLNPKQADAPGRIRAEIRTSGANRYLALVVDRETKRTDINYIGEFSDAMSLWNSGPPHTTTITDTPTSLVIRDNTTVSSKPSRFSRLKVQLLSSP